MLTGVWEIAAPVPPFGGFSALLDRGEAGFTAFSDRGWRLDFAPPGARSPSPRYRPVFADRLAQQRFFDIEAAVHDPATGRLWLASENNHAIHRLAADGTPAGSRALAGIADWGRNAGIEAMVRLADGRFILLPEGAESGLIFADDPVAGGAPATFRITLPGQGYAITDAAVLPDGRLMVLLRKLVSPLAGAWPPFASIIAVGDVPQAGGAFAPGVILPLEGVLPPENYEGLALRTEGDGAVTVWLMADDNLSAFQRTLLARLVFTP
jgi:hypothetical protein